MNFIYLQLFLLVYINSVVGEFLQRSSAPINMTRVIRSISTITYTACHMECEKEGECKSIAVTEASANQLPTCHLLKKDDGHNKGGHIMTTVQAIGLGLRVNGQWGCWKNMSACISSCGGGTMLQTRQCDSPEPKYGGDYCKGDAHRIVSCDAEKSISLIDRPIEIKKENKIATISQISKDYEIKFKLKVDASLMNPNLYYSVFQIDFKGCKFGKNCRQPGVFIKKQSSRCYIHVITGRNDEAEYVLIRKEEDFFDNPFILTFRQCKTSNGNYQEKVLLNGKTHTVRENPVARTFSDMNVYGGYIDRLHPPPPNGQISQLTIKGASGVKRITQPS